MRSSTPCSAHMIHINLNMIFYTHVEHSPIKTISVSLSVIDLLLALSVGSLAPSLSLSLSHSLSASQPLSLTVLRLLLTLSVWFCLSCPIIVSLCFCLYLCLSVCLSVCLTLPPCSTPPLLHLGVCCLFARPSDKLTCFVVSSCFGQLN